MENGGPFELLLLDLSYSGVIHVDKHWRESIGDTFLIREK